VSTESEHTISSIIELSDEPQNCEFLKNSSNTSYETSVTQTLSQDKTAMVIPAGK
jgi:hypothetical protein